MNKTFSLNGKKFLIKKNVTLKEIINYFDYQKTLSIVEYNNLISNSDKWQNIEINLNDKIEIISIVGGG
uniref:Thiamine biosynthesis protein n=1 Tax=Thalassionema bacillare TaxID=426664 RepID=UPI001EDDC3B6|nr:Thiamine biosynthesis protein [Thalassionema bacillare]UHY40470.1 Thiamine biosynthesis protein [Thalassionema bacillare]UHY40857.1 Thiamine biosynthesis protein [Thalassionema bacillare]UHY41115.1 Thiamine biosynthesis protein [Thalassionema bacillare]